MEEFKSNSFDWDDLAFAGKNKDYGAYLLRKRYRRMLLYAFLSVICFSVITVVALQVTQSSAVSVVAEPIDYTKYYGPKLPPPPPPPAAKPIAGVRKQAIQKTNEPQAPHTLPDNAMVQPKQDSVQIVDPVVRAREHPEEQYQSTANVPSDKETDHYKTVSESPQGSTGFDEPESTDDYGAFGSGKGFDLEELKYFPLLVSDDGTNTLQWVVDSRDSVITTRLNFMSNDLQALFVDGKNFVDKSPGLYFVRVNQFQAVNLMWVRHIKNGRVIMFTGHEINLEPKYEWELRKHLPLFLEKYLHLIARMRKQ